MIEAADLGRTWMSGVRRRLYEYIPRPRLSGLGAVARPRKILVLRKGPNPSFDYYLLARLRAAGVPHETRCIDRDGLDDIDPSGLLVIVCRYIRPSQLRWIEQHRASLAGVAYFVDDDVAAVVADGQTDLDYRLYLAWFACLPMARLNRVLTHLWVSTDALGRALGGAVLAPAPVLDDHLPLDRSGADSTLRIVYHATNVHHPEHGFLVPVMEEVMRRRPGIRFEVLARGSNRALWRNASIEPHRIDILAPMGWDAYRGHSRTQGADIALMPLMKRPSNDSRSDAKLIDCCRMGAAAIMSDVAPYRREAGAGIPLVTNTPQKWIETLLNLIDDEGARAAARHATRTRVARMALAAGEPFPGVASVNEIEATA